MHLENLLRNVQPNRCWLHHGSSSSSRAYQLAETRRVHPIRSRREREAWRLAILFHGFVWTWTQRISSAGEGIATSGMERLHQFLHPASERKGILAAPRMHAHAGPWMNGAQRCLVIS